MWASRDGSRNTCRYTVTHVDTHRNSLPVRAGLMCTCVAALRNYVTATELKSSTTAVPTVQYSTVQCKSVRYRGQYSLSFVHRHFLLPADLNH